MARRINTAMALTTVDHDVEAMLQKSQSKYFSGKGANMGKQLEEWIEKMDDYYNLAHLLAAKN